MGSAHKDQGRCQIVVVSLDEFLVVIPSDFAVALVEFSSMTLLVGGQAGLVFASRKSKRSSCRTQKKLTHPPVPYRPFPYSRPPSPFLRGPD